MSSKGGRGKHLVPTRSYLVAPSGAKVRVRHSANKPICTKCGNADHIVRLWHGDRKMWVCSVHFKVGSTKTEPQTLKERVLHRKPKQEEFGLTDILPNRAARRRRK